MPLMDYVRALEGKDNRSRAQQVLAILGGLGIEPACQECRFPRISNIIVDLPPGPGVKRVLFSAHYDAVPGSPGANDNASGVAVLLGLCHEQRHGDTPVRVIFFDREEPWLRTPVLCLGLLGSLYYTWKSDLRDVAAIYNLEFCGLGDFLGVWPVRTGEVNLPALRGVERAAARLGLPLGAVHIPWFFFTSDHLPFRLRGLSNALTLSLLPAHQVPALGRLLTGLCICKLLAGRQSALPEPLSFIHTREDTSTRLNEGSLRLMQSLLLELLQR